MRKSRESNKPVQIQLCKLVLTSHTKMGFMPESSPAA